MASAAPREDDWSGSHATGGSGAGGNISHSTSVTAQNSHPGPLTITVGTPPLLKEEVCNVYFSLLFLHIEPE